MNKRDPRRDYFRKRATGAMRKGKTPETLRLITKEEDEIIAKSMIDVMKFTTPCVQCGYVSRLLPTGIVRNPVSFYPQRVAASLVRTHADAEEVERRLTKEATPWCRSCHRRVYGWAH